MSSICTFSAGGALESRIDPERVQLFNVPRKWRYDLTLPVRLARFLKAHPVDILHTHSWGTLVEGVLAAKLADVPIVIHGEHGILRNRLRHRISQRLLWGGVDQLVAVSGPLADRMSMLVGQTRTMIEVVPNGVDADRFRPVIGRKTEYRKLFGLPEGGTLVGTVARLVPVKNCEGLLRSIARVRRDGLPVSLALAGDGPLRDELMQLARRLGVHEKTYFLGDVPSVSDFYRALDVFVLNSNSEGMSNTILEAMASGLPIVATDVGSNSELILSGSTGLLVPAGDTDRLSTSLSELIRDPELRVGFGRAARRRAEQIFSLDRMVRQYEAIYDRLNAKCQRSGELQ